MSATEPGPWARLRSLFVALGWIALLVTAGTGLSLLVLRFLPLPADRATRFAWQAGVLAGAFFLATGVVGRRLCGLSWQDLGWCLPGRRIGWLVLGVALGIALAAAAVGLSVPGSGATVSLRASHGSRALAPLLLALCAAALFEELAFRGAPLALLARAVGRWPATLVAAVSFGVAHLRNPYATLFSTLNIALAAVLLSIAFWSRGGMLLAWGLHFGWNAGLGLVVGAPVSGIAFDAAPFSYTAGLRPWVDGGAFGPEGGVTATLAMTAGVAVLVGRRFARPRAWLA